MQKRSPILINVPHSSTFIPPEEIRYFTITDLSHELAVMTDHYCDDLYNTGDMMLRFPVSRLICDPERFRDDSEEIMASKGMGAIYTACADGNRLKSISPSHKETLLVQYYDSFHNRFETKVAKKLQEFGECLIVDGHSFYDEPLPYELDQDITRPDICIGTDSYHTPREITEILCNYFTDQGYLVKINSPFSGSIVPLRYYQKERQVHSVMIELNRRLYMDHNLNKTRDYCKIKKDIAEAIDMLRTYEVSL